MPSSPVNCWATKKGCDRKFWSLRAREVDLVGLLGDLRQDGDAIRLDFREAERDQEVVFLLALAVPQRAHLERRQQRRVAWQDAEIAVGARNLHLVDLLPHEQPVGRHDLELKVRRNRGDRHLCPEP